jgi:hypothetical protein
MTTRTRSRRKKQQQSLLPDTDCPRGGKHAWKTDDDETFCEKCHEPATSQGPPTARSRRRAAEPPSEIQGSIVEAVKLLGSYTNGTFDVDAIANNLHTAKRRDIMATVYGRSLPFAACSATAVRQVLADEVGCDPEALAKACPAYLEAKAASGNNQPQAPAPAHSPAPAEETPVASATSEPDPAAGQVAPVESAASEEIAMTTATAKRPRRNAAANATRKTATTKAPATNKPAKKAAKAAGKPATKAEDRKVKKSGEFEYFETTRDIRGKLFDQPFTAVIRWMANAGMEFYQVRAILDQLGAKVVKDTTLRQHIGHGQRGERGKISLPAAVGDRLKAMGKAIKADREKAAKEAEKQAE